MSLSLFDAFDVRFSSLLTTFLAGDILLAGVFPFAFFLPFRGDPVVPSWITELGRI